MAVDWPPINHQNTKMIEMTINEQVRKLFSDGLRRSSRQAFDELVEVNSMKQISRAISFMRVHGELALAGTTDLNGDIQYVLAKPITADPARQAHVYSALGAIAADQQEDFFTKGLEDQHKHAEGLFTAYLHKIKEESGDNTLLDLFQLCQQTGQALANRRAQLC